MVDKVSRFQIYAIPFILSCIPTLLFILFGYLIQGIVKLSIVKFGGWERQKVIPEYMVGLFSWGFLSIVILPVLALSSAQNITEFLLDTFQPMEALLDTSKNSTGANLYNRRWECLFLPDSGAFFMNYLIISAGLRNHLSLHRFPEYLEELWGYCFHRYTAVKRVEVEKTREFNCIRNSENMSLAEDYTWILLHFSILSFFCVSFPLISSAFIVYILSKHVIDIECFRKYFKTVGTQPALLRTAIEINIFCGLLVQLNTVAFLFFRTSPGGEGLVRRMVAGNLIIFSILIFLIMESSRWRFPCNIFGKPKPTRSKPISNQIHEYRDRLFFEHLVTSI
ncbi:CSC1-like protein 1 [Eurytemora carolleeae]|uniref:CSC1-like protein 1 n=1 Tax=Eurytemora carolleeae TaxID=1294199 RepID=UPI000C78234F|nr:CSC1-like protein 1 [Eurytemora carolleeae]|eukprot:XP_023320752.1 CSC1-like protein 1 [Eurytemora affinis]